MKEMPTIDLSKVSKTDLVLDPKSHTAIFTLSTSKLTLKSTIHVISFVVFHLVGIIRRSWFKGLWNSRYRPKRPISQEIVPSKTAGASRIRSVSTEDGISAWLCGRKTAVFAERECNKSVRFLVGVDCRDLSNVDDLIPHLCQVFGHIYRYMHGFTRTHSFNPLNYTGNAIRDRRQFVEEVVIGEGWWLQTRSSFRRYIYFKTEYMKMKNGESVDLRISAGKRKGRKVLRSETDEFLSKEYKKEDVIVWIVIHI